MRLLLIIYIVFNYGLILIKAISRQALSCSFTFLKY